MQMNAQKNTQYCCMCGNTVLLYSAISYGCLFRWCCCSLLCIPKNFRRVQQNLSKQRHSIVCTSHFYWTVVKFRIKNIELSTFIVHKHTNRPKWKEKKDEGKEKKTYRASSECEKLSARFLYLNMIALSKQNQSIEHNVRLRKSERDKLALISYWLMPSMWFHFSFYFPIFNKRTFDFEKEAKGAMTLITNWYRCLVITT